MKNILFVVPDSTGIKNYLYSHVLKHLRGFASVSVLAPFSLERLIISGCLSLDFIHWNLVNEPFVSRWLRESATYARLKHNALKVKNRTIISNWNRSSGHFIKRVFFIMCEILGSVLALDYRLILLVERCALLFWKKKTISDYEMLLLAKSIDKIFITHQRSVEILPICLAAKNLEVEVVSVIYSWDNVPKARLNIKADRYFVWSNYMKDEMVCFYPEIESSSIVVTGTPQFEFYRNENGLMSRQSFAMKYGLNPAKKWILYSGSDVRTSPHDHDYLKDLAGELMGEENIQIIFRDSPADLTDRYANVLRLFEGKVVHIPPFFTPGTSWSSRIPLKEDLYLLQNLVHHSELAVNIGSTIAHDFASLNKPTVYLNYDQENTHWSVKTIYNFQHFRSMPSVNCVVWVNGKYDLRRCIVKTLKFPETEAGDRLTWLQKINYHNSSSTPSMRIAKALLD